MTASAGAFDLLAPLVISAMLGFARIGGAVMLMPGWGETLIPMQVRLGLAVAITLVLLPMLPAVPATLPPIQLGARIAAELAAGIWIGLMARLFALALPSAAQIISYQIGLSSVILPDATLGGEATLLSAVFGLLAPVLILTTPLYRLPLEALLASYRIIPPGAGFTPETPLKIAVALTAQSFALGVQLAAPFLLAGMIWQVGIGAISRFVPHIQIFLVSLPAQLLGGLALLALLMLPLLLAFEHAAGAGFTRVFGG